MKKITDKGLYLAIVDTSNNLIIKLIPMDDWYKLRNTINSYSLVFNVRGVWSENPVQLNNKVTWNEEDGRITSCR